MLALKIHPNNGFGFLEPDSESVNYHLCEAE